MIKRYKEFNESVISKYNQFKSDLRDEINDDLKPALDIISDIVNILNDYEDKGNEYSIDDFIIDAENRELISLELDLKSDKALITTESIDIIGIDTIIETFKNIEDRTLVINISLSKWDQKIFRQFKEDINTRFPPIDIEATDWEGEDLVFPDEFGGGGMSIKTFDKDPVTRVEIKFKIKDFK